MFHQTKPEGVYWGDVSVTEALLDTVNQYFQPPTPEEAWAIVEYYAADE